MKIPHWSDLTNEQRFELQDVASGFGVTVPENYSQFGNRVYLDRANAGILAMEIYMFSKAIIEKSLEDAKADSHK